MKNQGLYKGRFNERTSDKGPSAQKSRGKTSQDSIPRTEQAMVGVPNVWNQHKAVVTGVEGTVRLRSGLGLRTRAMAESRSRCIGKLFIRRSQR